MQTVERINPVQDGQLAEQLERDIHRRGLKCDDKYLSTRSVAKFFNVSLSAAAQAMQDLTDRDILIRRDRSGTFVGPRVKAPATSAIKFVGILLPESRAESVNVSLDALIHALRHRDKSLSVHISFLPTNHSLAFLRDLLDAPHLSAQKMVGMIPISCTRDVCQHIHQIGIPMVVLGTPDPDQQHLPHVDSDHFESGRLMAKHLIDAGHRQLALLTPSGGRSGDHAFHEGVLEAMAGAEVPPNALVARITSHDFSLFKAQVEAVLQRDPMPTGIICRPERMLDPLFEVIADAGLNPADDVDVVYEQSALAAVSRRRPGLSYVSASMDYDIIADRIAETLLAQLGNDAPTQDSLVIPVQLETEPKHLG